MSSFGWDELRAALEAVAPEAADRPGAVRLVRAPGRVNLIGEHTDYNLGWVLPAAIDREIRIAALPTDDGRVELTRLPSGERGGFDLDGARPRDGTWLDYIAGTAWSLRTAGHRLTGLRGVIASDLPENSGLSSSAAIELASAWALLVDDVVRYAAGEATTGGATTEDATAGEEVVDGLDRLTLARLCQRAENAYVGVQSGLMDQFAASCGEARRALLLDCRSLDWRPIALPDDVAMVVLHSGSPRKLDGSAYNERRAQCEAAVAALADLDPSIESLRDVSATELAEGRHRMEPVVARRAEHVIAENDRVLATVRALEAGDLGAVGRLFAASHASLRDLYEVSSPELDALVDIATGVPGVLAARMTGAGFGGCTVNLVRPDAVDALRQAILAEYPARTGLTPTVLPVVAADGAGRVA